MKYCKRCDRDLPDEAFGRRRTGKATRLAPYCKLCDAARHREWVANNPDKPTEYQRAWRARSSDA